jgi:hypothetical protein
MINKWTIAGIGFLAALLFTAYNSARIATKLCDAKISALEKKHADETIQIQQITIEQLDKNVKTKKYQEKLNQKTSNNIDVAARGEWVQLIKEARINYSR